MQAELLQDGDVRTTRYGFWVHRHDYETGWGEWFWLGAPTQREAQLACNGPDDGYRREKES